MSRNTIIIAVVVGILVIGGGAYLALNQGSLLPGSSTKNTNKTTGNGATTNAPANLSLPEEIKGDVSFTGKLKVGAVDVVLNSLEKQTISEGRTAEKGKTYLVIYVDPVPATSLVAVDKGLRPTTIVDGSTTYPLVGLKTIGPAVKNDRGYLKFLVPEKFSGMMLTLGEGASKQQVKLP